MSSRCPEQGWARPPLGCREAGPQLSEVQTWPCKAGPSLPPAQVPGTGSKAWPWLSPWQKLGPGPRVLCPDLDVPGQAGWLQREMVRRGLGGGCLGPRPAWGLREGRTPAGPRGDRRALCLGGRGEGDPWAWRLNSTRPKEMKWKLGFHGCFS